MRAKHILIAGVLAAGCFVFETPAAAQSDPSVERETDVFMWLGGRHLFDREPEMTENLLLFARRQGIIPYESGANTPAVLRAFLRRAKAAGLERTWIEIGPGDEETGGATVREFVEDPQRRKETLARFRELARIYKQFYPDFARITLFDEAPLGAFESDTSGGQRSYRRDARMMEEYGPQAFAYMKAAIQEVMPQAEVGLFLHHPHNASSEMAGRHSFIASFMQKAQALEATPDFIYSDVYRGYFARGYGEERTNAYITDVVAHTKQVAERYDVEAYQLGQVHTIKLGYTPSRREIDSNVQAILAGRPDGLGWYWPNYASTNYVRLTPDSVGRPADYDISTDPFVPNAWGKIGPAGSLYGTSRDRFTYSYLRIKEAVGDLDPAKRFDLWLYGHDFDHVEHKVFAQTRQGAWELIGHFNPQQDADGYVKEARSELMYSYDGRWHAVAFHALRRSRFLDEQGRLHLKVTTPKASDGSRLSAAYVMPYRPTRNYLTEEQITTRIEEHPRWIAVNSLARRVRPRPRRLKQGKDFTVTLTGDSGAPASRDSLRTN